MGHTIGWEQLHHVIGHRSYCATEPLQATYRALRGKMSDQAPLTAHAHFAVQAQEQEQRVQHLQGHHGSPLTAAPSACHQCSGSCSAQEGAGKRVGYGALQEPSSSPFRASKTPASAGAQGA